MLMYCHEYYSNRDILNKLMLLILISVNYWQYIDSESPFKSPSRKYIVVQ